MASVYLDFKTTTAVDKEYVRWQLSLYRYLHGLNHAQKADFKEDNHTYWINDRQLISVTQLLKKHNLATDYSAVNPEVLNAKAERGTYIHKEIEHYLKKGETGFTSELQDFIDWQEKNKVTTVGSEVIVNNDIIAGTIDFIADSPNFNSEIIILHLDGKKCTAYPLELIPNEEIERLIECERNGEIYKEKELDIKPHLLKEIYSFQLTIQAIEKKKKEAEDNALAVREIILAAMKAQGIKSYTNDFLRLTYVAPFEEETIDSKKLREELPEVAERYSKSTQVKESIRIKLRGAE